MCSKRWVHEQYDTMVQTNTVIGSGRRGRRDADQGDSQAGRTGWAIERGLAMALDGNGRWAYLDPKLGAMHAVAEAARKVAMTGATPVAATNCLNFGNPEKPEIMAQLSAAIDGIAEACTALGTPITGGNVSLYNETKGEGIYPTPVLGIVGILDDVTKAVPAQFQQAGDAILLLWPVPRGEEAESKPCSSLHIRADQIPTSSMAARGHPCAARADDYVGTRCSPRTRRIRSRRSSRIWELGVRKVVLGELWGTPPALDLEAEADLHKLLIELSWRRTDAFGA